MHRRSANGRSMSFHISASDSRVLARLGLWSQTQLPERVQSLETSVVSKIDVCTQYL